MTDYASHESGRQASQSQMDSCALLVLFSLHASPQHRLQPGETSGEGTTLALRSGCLTLNPKPYVVLLAVGVGDEDRQQCLECWWDTHDKQDFSTFAPTKVVNGGCKGACRALLLAVTLKRLLVSL